MRSVKEIMRDSAVLDPNGVHIGGSDRESNHHYGDAYEHILTIQCPNDDPGDVVRTKYPHSIRGDVKLMMEVGVADGSSLLAWREVFPNALCVGLDIHPSERARGDRIEFYRGDATSWMDCERATGGLLFDLIVDDATHRLGDTLQTLLYLWPHIRAGGLYVIEEFASVGTLRGNITAMWPFVYIVDTVGPFGGVEPLVVLRKKA